MKVLYIGHYKEASGWGQVARDYILALDSVGVEVVPRAIRLGNPVAELSPRLIQLEQQNTSDCDVCVQHVLPHYMKCDNRFSKNIGLFELETSHIQHTSWARHLDLMTDIWVPCNSMVKELQQSNIGTQTKISVVPHTFDIQTYSKSYQRLGLPTNNRFVFYFIGELNKRKHLSALLTAFHTEFKLTEPVELVIKVNKFGSDVNSLTAAVQDLCNKVKNGLRLYKDPSRYKPEILITTEIQREDILRLHASCDCFVMPSYGEAWCIPAWEAMAMGNLVITSATGAMLDYIDSERNGFLVGGSMEPVFGNNETFEEFGTSREHWFNISISKLMQTMRRVYEMDKAKQSNVKCEAKMSAYQYDYKIVGQQMKELLSV